MRSVSPSVSIILANLPATTSVSLNQADRPIPPIGVTPTANLAHYFTAFLRRADPHRFSARVESYFAGRELRYVDEQWDFRPFFSGFSRDRATTRSAKACDKFQRARVYTYTQAEVARRRSRAFNNASACAFPARRYEKSKQNRFH